MDSDGESGSGRRQEVAGVVTATLPTLRQAQGRPEQRRRAGASGEGCDEVAEVAGVIIEQLPSGLFRVKLEGGRLVFAHITGKVDRNFVRILVGDRVRVELSPIDIGRGRIVEKL